LATGGTGKLFEFTTNSEIATGDGIRFAENLGARVENLDLVQFHPTGFIGESGEVLLISEAVRGEGAVLLNAKGERFVDELLPRDKVSQAILSQPDCVYLDISHRNPDFVKSRFPMIYERLSAHGYDLTRDRIPVRPCQHYLMGGIAVDANGRTTLPNLYAAGECASTGVHGNNRLASNSLLESVVFARRTAENIAENTGKNTERKTKC
jgi:L-aspartate oxidase